MRRRTDPPVPCANCDNKTGLQNTLSFTATGRRRQCGTSRESVTLTRTLVSSSPFTNRSNTFCVSARVCVLFFFLSLLFVIRIVTTIFVSNAYAACHRESRDIPFAPLLTVRRTVCAVRDHVRHRRLNNFVRGAQNEIRETFGRKNVEIERCRFVAPRARPILLCPRPPSPSPLVSSTLYSFRTLLIYGRRRNERFPSDPHQPVEHGQRGTEEGRGKYYVIRNVGGCGGKGGSTFRPRSPPSAVPFVSSFVPIYVSTVFPNCPIRST